MVVSNFLLFPFEENTEGNDAAPDNDNAKWRSNG